MARLVQLHCKPLSQVDLRLEAQKPLPEAEKLRYKRCGSEQERRACREVIETGNVCPESRAGGWGSSAGERGSVRTDSRAVREQPGERAGVPGLRLDGSPEFRSGGRGAGDYALVRQGKTRTPSTRGFTVTRSRELMVGAGEETCCGDILR